MSTGIRMLVSRSSFDLTKSVLGILPERMIETTATGAGARRGGAGEIRQDRQSAARRQRLVPRPQQRLGRTDRRPRQARRATTARCCRPTPASPIRPTIPASPAAAWPRSSGWRTLGVIDERMLIVHSGWLEPRGGRDPGEAQAVAGLRAVVEPAQRLRQFRVRQAARTDGARRQRRDRLRPCLVRHRRHVAGDAARLLLLQGDAHQPARHAAGDRPRDGDHQRRQGGADGRPHRLASRSARRPTSCCSTPSGRNGSR